MSISASVRRPFIGCCTAILTVCLMEGLSTAQFGSSPAPVIERERPAAESPPSASPQGLGQLLIQDAQSESPVRLNVARYHVNVVIQPPVALIQIDQSFYNPYHRQQEGQFIFNLPDGASVSRFAMYVTRTELIEGELIERKRASEIYESIVRRKRDPAILEQIGDNLFKMRVFPVFARDEKRILLDYTLPLEPQDGEYEFRLPLLSDLAPVWDFRVTGVIRGAIDPKSISSPSHPDLALQTDRDGAVSLTIQEQNYRPETDLVVRFAKRPARQPTLRTFVAEPIPAPLYPSSMLREEATYFLAEIPSETEGDTTPPADVLLLVDTSSSINDLEALRDRVHEILRNLRPDDRLRLACVDVALRPLHDAWLSPKSPELVKAVEQLDQQFTLGGTDILGCMRDAVWSFEDSGDGRRRLIIYVGDGGDEQLLDLQPPQIRPMPDWLAQTQAALIGVAVQQAEVPRLFMQSLAEESGGIWFDLAGDVRAAGRLSSWLRAGLPSAQKVRQVTVEGAAAEDLYWRPKAWVPGEPLHVYGRIPKGRNVRISVELDRGDQEITRQWTLDNEGGEDDVFVGRLWAQRRLDELRHRHGADDEIVAISQEWSLLSPHTAFLVLESESDYETWNINRQMRHRYWTPPDVRPEAPLPPEWLAEATSLKEPRVSAQQFEEAIAQANEALANGDHTAAHGLLRAVRKSPLASASEEYDRLNRQALEGVQSRTLFQSQGLYRALLDPTESKPWWDLQPSILTLAGAAFRAGPDFLRRHPHADALMQEVDIRTLGDGRTLELFAAALADLTGTNVTLDRRAIDGYGIDLDTPMGRELPRPSTPATERREVRRPSRSKREGPMPPDPFGDPDDPADASFNPFADPPEPPDPSADPFGPSPDGNRLVRESIPDEVEPAKVDSGTASPGVSNAKISLRSCVAHLLRPLDLVLVEQPNRLLITTPERAESLSTTEVYPVADLLFTDRVVDLPSLISNPYMDRQETARRRIEAKLKQPMPADYADVTLESVMADVASFLDDTVLIDERALDDYGIGTDVPISASCKDVPARQALHWMLDDLDLTYAIWDEALVITVLEEAESRLDVRLHTGRGLLYEFPAASSPFPLATGRGMGGGGRGFSGGMGGGMGGMGGGFFGGGMGGGMGGFGAPSRPAGQAGMSSGGGDSQPAQRQPENVDLSTASVVHLPSRPSSDVAPEQPTEQQYVYEVDTDIELVTSSIAPTTWDTVGGPGTIGFFPNTLDFVIGQTADVHEQIELLFERLRSLPPQLDDRMGGRPATVHPVGSGDVAQLDFDTLIDLITSSIWPYSWDSVGGPGSIEGEPYRVALVVTQTEPVHDDVLRLLTLLRRSRYEAVHGTRPWQTSLSGLAVAAEHWTHWRADSSDEGLLTPTTDELRLLEVRHDSLSVATEWRRTDVESRSDTISIRSVPGQLECRLADCLVRTDRVAAAVAWPSLQLVEFSDYAETILRIIDTGLPWLPHRSNLEIAQLFHVQPDATSAEGPQADGRIVWLRLVPAGLPVDGDTYLRMAFTKGDGRVCDWESFVSGQLTARIHFADSDPAGTQPEDGEMIMEDAARRRLVRWNVLDADFADGEIPELAAGWDGYIQLDRRKGQTAQDAPFAEALADMGDFKWSAASRQLNGMIGERGFHPMLGLLDAWCRENDPRIGPRQQMLDRLAEVAEGAASTFVHRVLDAAFPSLTDQERYKILSQQPVNARSVADCLRLAEAATVLGSYAQALEHVERALGREADSDEPSPPPAERNSGGEGRVRGGDSSSAARPALRPDDVDRHETSLRRLQVQSLAKLDRAAEALDVAENWAAGERVSYDDLAAMGEVLAQCGQPTAAEQMFAAALAGENLDKGERYKLLIRLAGARRGIARWEAIVQAAELQPLESAGRRACLNILREELRTTAHAAFAGQLAAQTKDGDLAAALLIRQAELTSDTQLASDLPWKVYQQNRLGDERLAWAVRAWHRAGDMPRIIEACERELRNGKRLPADVAVDLAVAYRATDRDTDANRAETRDAKPKTKKVSPNVNFSPRRTGGGMF